MRALRGADPLTGRGRIACAAALAAALALSACGGSDDPAPADLGRFGSAQSLQRLTCADWTQADPQERKQFVRRLREIVGGPVTGAGASGRGTVLDDDEAYRLFDGHCGRSFARAFTLYKLYGQAAGFAGRAP